jgi:hypothetical protein
MLEFCPCKRLTVEEALEHEFLAPLRDSSRDSSVDVYSDPSGGLSMEIERMPLLVGDDIRNNVSSSDCRESLITVSYSLFR